MTAAPGADEAPLDVARRALAGRRELALLDEPSVATLAALLGARFRRAEPLVRAAVSTLDRFRREVALDGLAALLAAGRADPAVAQRSLQRLAHRHDGLTGGQLAQLALGPRLWWTASGVDVPWRPLSTAGGAVPIPGRAADPDVRLLLLAVIGSGATEEELRAVRVGDAGRLTASGELVPDLATEPLAVRYRDAATGAEHLALLSWEARAALHERLEARGGAAGLDPQEPLLLPADRASAASAAARDVSAALIGAGNDVNVTLCRATGDFFRAWGMPGARFAGSDEAPPGPGRLVPGRPGAGTPPVRLSAGAPAPARPADLEEHP